MCVNLRRFTESDIRILASLANNVDIAANLRDAFPHPYTGNDSRNFINLCLAADEQCDLYRAVAVDGALAGCISLSRGTDVYRKCAELGYWLGRQFWGMGVASEAVRQMCGIGFAKWDIVRIYAEPFSRNAASRRVLEKNGFAHEGTKRKSVYKNREFLDSELYAVLKP